MKILVAYDQGPSLLITQVRPSCFRYYYHRSHRELKELHEVAQN